MKFLESGFGLQPLVAQPLALPWNSPPKTTGHPHPQPPHQQQQQQQGALATAAAVPLPSHNITAHWPPNAGPQQEQQQSWHILQSEGQALASSRGVGLPTQQQQPIPAVLHKAASLQPASQQLLPHTAGSAASGAAAHSSALTPPAPGPGISGTSMPGALGSSQGAAPQKSISSTAELISSMHNRFSEADEFLRSLQRP